jgi:nucleotide-binding universal stress UspA family protein
MKAKAGIDAKRILVPIDLQKCPFEVFERINAYVERSEVMVILLHVLNLNIVSPETRVYDELEQEAHQHLERLARENIHPSATVLIRVRFGKSAREIQAEATAQKADLVILPVFDEPSRYRPPSLWERISALVFPDLAQELVRALPCALLTNVWCVNKLVCITAGRRDATSCGSRDDAS